MTVTRSKLHAWLAVLLCGMCLDALRPASALAGDCQDASFEILSPLPTPEDLNAVAIAPAGDGTVIVVAGQGGAFFVSHDLGRTFVPPTLPEEAQGVDWTDVSTPAPGVFTASGDELVLRSDDLGVTWSAVKLPDGVAGPVTWRERESLVVAPARHYTAKSADSGASWETYQHDELIGVDRDAFFTDESHGFGVGRRGLFTTEDGGRNWRPILLASDRPTPLTSIAFHLDGELGAVGGRGILYQTSDGGRTWAPTTLDERSEIQAIAIPTGDAIFGLARNGAVWRSTDGGGTFDSVELPEGELTDIAFLDAQTGLVTGPAGALFMTRDGGDSWTQLRKGEGRTIHAVVAMGDRWLAAGAGGETVVSDDATRWTPVQHDDLPGVYDLATDGERIMATAQGGIVTDSLDVWANGGVELIEKGPAGDSNLFSRVVSRASGEFHLLLNGRLYRTRDGSELTPIRLQQNPRELLEQDGVLFVVTDNGVLRSANGRSFKTFGPGGLRIDQLAALSRDEVVAKVQGGLVVRIDEEEATVLAMEPQTRFIASHVVSEGLGLVGAPHGLIVEVRLNTPPRLHSLGVNEAVVSIASHPENGAAALTSSGRLFVSEDLNQGWQEAMVSQPWAELPGSMLGGDDLATRGVGILRFDEVGLLAGGPRGQMRRFGTDLKTALELETGVVSDVTTLSRAGNTLLLGGSGRTVMTSTDGGDSWKALSDDLAPEMVTGIRFDTPSSGMVTTDSGSVLRFVSLDEPIYELLGREPPPLTGLTDPGGDGALLWLANGAGELVYSTDLGDTWQLSELPMLKEGLSAFHGRGEWGLAVGPGSLRLGKLDPGNGAWSLTVPRVPVIEALFGDSDADYVLAIGQGGAVYELGDGAEARCYDVSQVPDLRDAAYQGSWTVVGRGGLIGRLSTMTKMETGALP